MDIPLDFLHKADGKRTAAWFSMMQAIKETLKVINLFIVISRVSTLSLALQASSEAAIPIKQSRADLANLLKQLMLLRHTERAAKNNYYPLPIIYFFFCFMNFMMISHSSAEDQTYKKR